MFDTDGGGTIDRSELHLAMVALGFQNKKSIKKHNVKTEDSTVIESIASDGAVTLEEFNALMMGELSGGDPRETLHAVFAVLSQSIGGSNFITFGKLQSVCKDYKVMICSKVCFCPLSLVLMISFISCCFKARACISMQQRLVTVLQRYSVSF